MSGYGDAEPELTCTFNGSGMGVYMAVNTSTSIHGLLDIYIDGQIVEKGYNLGGASGDLKQQLVWETRELENREHTIMLKPRLREILLDGRPADQAIFDFFKVYGIREDSVDLQKLHEQLPPAPSKSEKLYTPQS